MTRLLIVGAEVEPSLVQSTLGTPVVIGLVIALFVVFLIIVDISCYFLNGCGLTMCMCVHLCGKEQAKTQQQQMEEGERLVLLTTSSSPALYDLESRASCDSIQSINICMCW